MREMIRSNVENCTGCNRCIRVCPVDEVNTAYYEDGKSKVKINSEKCIGCGACIEVCKHEARSYDDDTEIFFQDLNKGANISLFVAPANRTQFRDWKQMIYWLRSLGVRKIFDVSLGADICTWAHIRFIQKESPGPIITQPCPAIVNYITKHKPEIVKYLSPIHSPMLCTAIYMKYYEGITDKIAALSPCIAKISEFEDTGIVSYNITFNKLSEYIEKHNISLPEVTSNFDHFEASLGRIYSMPGGLKENVEYFLGKALRIDKSEGHHIVYRALDDYAVEKNNNLPSVFDVLNCQEGCNLGTGCNHKVSSFEVNGLMNNERQLAMNEYSKDDIENLYKEYDEKLELNDFVRKYKPNAINKIRYTIDDLENAFLALGKDSKEQREYNCYACGSQTCYEMAVKIAKGINVPENCIERARENYRKEHNVALEEQKRSRSYITQMMKEISEIKQISDGISSNIDNIDEALRSFSLMSSTINKLSMQTNLISLNASIEAARVGKYGLSFAVVAQEIRNLALSSQESVEANSESCNTAMVALKNINEMIFKSSQLIDTTYSHIRNLYEG